MIEPIKAQSDPMDSVEVSLLTCSPHEEIYSLYGHSALRWHDLHKEGPHAGEDWVFNWGIFNFNKPHFVLRFVFGLTDYELGTFPFSYFWPYYEQWGSSITEQVINLTNDEKRRVQKALAENLRAENRIYRYNFFYDNCSTRPRDIILHHIEGKVEFHEREGFAPTYREMVRQCNRNHDWSRFGNDLLLGVKADLKSSREEQEFLPENLMHDFATAQVYHEGNYRPLVKQQRQIVAPGVQIVERDFPVTPTACALLLLIFSVGMMWIEWRRKKTFKWWDVTLMTVQGLAGCILFVMIFSEHPTTSLNLNLLMLNPLPLFFIPAVIRRKHSRWWRIEITLLALFAIGSLIQSYPEGMMIVALSLLLRVIVNEKK